jgi:uncharacterized OB-fold protein
MWDEFIKGNLRPADSDTPADAHITLVTLERPDEVTLWVESAEFAEVEEGAVVPVFTPTFTAWRD